MGKITHLTETVETRKSVFGQWNTDFEISTVSSQKGSFDQDIQDTKTNFGSLECLEIRKDKICKFGKYKTTIYKTNWKIYKFDLKTVQNNQIVPFKDLIGLD